MGFDTTLTPEVTWAQRSSTTEAEKNYVFLTIVAPDVPKADTKLDIQESKLSFSGPSQSKKVNYAVDLEFYGEIDPKETRTHHNERALEFVLRKKELKEEFWPRLLKDSKKQHFLKTDFDKWVDEDEQEEQGEEEDYMSKMNPMGGGGDGGFGGIDFSKLGAGGAGGMPDLGDMGAMANMGAMGDMGAMGAMGGEDGGESSDDDEDMPSLEDDSDKPAAGKAKIEEVA